MNRDLAHDHAVAKGWGPMLVPVDDAAEGFRRLAAGRADALLIAKLVGLHTIRQLGLTNVGPVGPPLTGFTQKFGFAVQKGNADLLASLNEGLAIVKTNGVYDVLYERWFGAREPKPVPIQRLFTILVPGLGVLGIVIVAYVRQRHLVRQLTQHTRTLHESEERFRATFEQAAVGIAHVTPAGLCLRVNQRLCDIVGYARDELLEMRLEDITYPDDLEVDVPLVRRLLAGEIPRFAIEKRYVHRGGNIVWANVTVVLTRDAAGEADYFIPVIEDITARKDAQHRQDAAEERIRQSSQTLLELARSPTMHRGQLDDSLREIMEVAARGMRVARVSIWVYDHARIRCLDAFDASRRRHDRCPDFEISRFPLYFDALARDRFISASDACRDPRTREFAESDLRPRGTASLLDVTVSLGGAPAGLVRFEHVGALRRWAAEEEMLAGSVADLVALVLETNERCRVESERKHSLSLLNATFNSTADGLLVVDREGKVVRFNETFVALWRIPPTLMATRDDRVLIDFVLDQLADPGVFLAKVRELYGRPQEVSFDVLEFKDGRTFERYSRPQLLDGVIVGRVWSFRDVTERSRVEDANRRLEAQLAQAQKLEALGTLAGGIAHDFNNILAGMLAHAELAMLDLTADHPARARVVEITRAIQRARETVRQILAFSRDQPTERKAIALGPVVREALDLLRATLPASMGVETRLPVHEPILLADASQMHQVLLNLCTNAAQAMGEGAGRLTIALEVVDVDARFADAHPRLRPGPHACLSVRDSGHGMDEATLTRIFEPFFTTRPTPGTGLGLAVVHGIVQSHDGAVVVESRPAAGTVVRLYLPMLDADADAEDGGDEELRWGKGEQLLLVDDEPSVVHAASRILERLGYRVTAFTDAEEALAAFGRDPRRFAVVLADLIMPQFRGTDLARALLDIRPDLPIILATGYGGGLDVAAVRELGCRDLLAKPFRMQAVADAVYRALRP